MPTEKSLLVSRKCSSSFRKRKSEPAPPGMSPLLKSLWGSYKEPINIYGAEFLYTDHVTVSFARSGSPGGQNVNKVNTKVDKRFNVKQAYWLSDWIRERIMQMVRKEKLGDRITALHQLVSPFGKSCWTFSKIQKSLFLHGSCFEEFIELHFHATDMFHTRKHSDISPFSIYFLKNLLKLASWKYCCILL
ncbi:peptidyl-tRNA hydrolase ICT1, mitochondrial isoform X1 [Gossypium hirsutum]|uniref:Peptidyl-tRNA hydrolase ICT1, mitochondrial isoform X1 n=1 Tax=Gossypium hirsutum TaxID=3635 RepID=A0A1U8HPG7_GOSHI|nr:peptidyl-tRNA hydrolase ICT1, mitochondrial isoform X1 [Gossypium hirsutum]